MNVLIQRGVSFLNTFLFLLGLQNLQNLFLIKSISNLLFRTRRFIRQTQARRIEQLLDLTWRRMYGKIWGIFSICDQFGIKVRIFIFKFMDPLFQFRRILSFDSYLPPQSKDNLIFLLLEIIILSLPLIKDKPLYITKILSQMLYHSINQLTKTTIIMLNQLSYLLQNI